MNHMDYWKNRESDQKQILVGMSGGVDSSAAVLLLKEQGFPVKGMILRMHDECMSSEDLSNGKLPHSIWYAGEAARRLRLDFSIWDVREEFSREVIEQFIKGSGVRYNPDVCVHCCEQFLFPLLLQAADRLGCSHVASGHYAVTGYDEERGRYVIRKGKDVLHDESHMLYRLSQEQLSRLLTPLGTYEKEEIRLIAQGAKLKNAFAPESPVICFIPDRQYREYLKGKVSPEVLEHVEDPMDQEAGSETLLRAGSICWSGIVQLAEDGMKMRARIRNAMNESDAFARMTKDGVLEVQLAHPLRGAVPGQSIVLYDGDVVAMGGIIKESVS